MLEHLLNWLGRRWRRLTRSPAVGWFLAGYRVPYMETITNRGLSALLTTYAPPV